MVIMDIIEDSLIEFGGLIIVCDVKILQEWWYQLNWVLKDLWVFKLQDCVIGEQNFFCRLCIEGFDIDF